MGSSIFLLDWVHSGPVLSVRASVRMGSASSMLDFMHAEQLGSTQCALCALCALCIAMYCLLRSLLHPWQKWYGESRYAQSSRYSKLAVSPCSIFIKEVCGILRWLWDFTWFHSAYQQSPVAVRCAMLCHVVPCCATPRPSNLFRSTADSVPQPLCGPMFYMNVSVFPLSLIAIFWGHPLNSQIQLFATYQCLSYFHVLIAPSEIPSGIPFQAYTVCVYVHIYRYTHACARRYYQ